MMTWLQQNWGTLVAVGVIALVCIAIVCSRIRARKRGTGGCGCGCGGCSMQSICHSKKPPKDQ